MGTETVRMALMRKTASKEPVMTTNTPVPTTAPFVCQLRNCAMVLTTAQAGLTRCSVVRFCTPQSPRPVGLGLGWVKIRVGVSFRHLTAIDM